MKLTLVGDVHISSIPPSVRTESYPQDILDKLEWIMDYSNRQHVDAVVLLGDVFHSKIPHKTPHGLVQSLAFVLLKSRAPVLIVPGNHDMRNDRYESLSSQPLGSLALHPHIELLDGLDSHGLGVFGIPYTEDRDKFQAKLYHSLGVNLFAAHVSIFPPGIHPPYPHWNADELDTHDKPLAYGHIHDPHGYYFVNHRKYLSAKGAWFCNNGAISRGSLHEETLKRKLKVTLFDDSTPDKPFMDIPLPYKPAEEVFKLAEHYDKQDKVAKLDDFLQSVAGVSFTALSVEEVVNHVETSALLDSSAVQEMKEIIETVS